jgi:hypothetical protein
MSGIPSDAVADTTYPLNSTLLTVGIVDRRCLIANSLLRQEFLGPFWTG